MMTSKLPSLIGMRSISKVPGLMTHLVASLTLDSERSCVMQGEFLTQGKASSIPTIFSCGDSISPDGFLPSIMLLLVIIVAVAIVVTVILVVVVGGEGVPLCPVFLLVFSVFSMVAAYASRAAATLSATSFLMVA
ncbi:hypothetical protein Tco_1461871 [Tanacetum coccineum]